MGQQVATLKEANLSLQTKLDEARIDLDRAEQNVTSLVQSITEAESGM